jgi:hypothetical protein
MIESVFSMADFWQFWTTDVAPRIYKQENTDQQNSSLLQTSFVNFMNGKADKIIKNPILNQQTKAKILRDGPPELLLQMVKDSLFPNGGKLTKMKRSKKLRKRKIIISRKHFK